MLNTFISLNIKNSFKKGGYYKKNATFITINPTLAKWVSEQLQNAPIDLNYELEDLQQSFKDLINSNINNLILEISDNTSPLFVDEKLTFGELTIYPKNRKVLRNNIEIILPPKEFDILYFLAKNKGEVFTKEQIYQAVLEEDFLLSDNNIMAFIRKLRKKIEPQPDSPEYIITIWGIGYKFNENIKKRLSYYYESLLFLDYKIIVTVLNTSLASFTLLLPPKTQIAFSFMQASTKSAKALISS